jgi:hypothetical protein
VASAKKTGEVIPARPVLQIEGLDNRGLVQLFTLTVPDTKPLKGVLVGWSVRPGACLGSWRVREPPRL